MTDANAVLAQARAALRAADVPLAALGAYAERGRVLRRAPRIRRIGSAWRLGVLLVTPDGEVLATGRVIRAAADVPRGYAAESARERAAERAAAARGGFAEGETVHVDWAIIDLDAVGRGAASGPLSLVGGVPMVRWSSAGGLRRLDDYVREQLEIALHPPAGA